MIRLTKRQREILIKMRDGADLAVSRTQAWCGDDKTSLALFWFLVRHILISPDDMSNTYYHINESGKLLLEGRQDIYRMDDGRYVEDWQAAAFENVTPENP